MDNSRYNPPPNPNRRNACFGCAGMGVIFLGLIVLWWTAAMRNPVVDIPTSAMPKPNAFDYYVSAGNAVVGDKQIGDAVATKPLTPYSLGQKEALVQQNASVIQTLHQGFAYPYLSPPARSINALFPYFAKFRGVARLLSLRGQVKAARGDWRGAADSYLDAIRLGEDVPHGSVLIGELVGVACQAIGRRPMWETANHLNAAQAHAASMRLQSILARRFSYADTLQEEKRFGQSALLEMFRNPKTFNTAMNSNSPPSDPEADAALSMSQAYYLLYSKSRIMHNYTTYMDQFAAQSRQSYGLHLPPPPMPTDLINRSLLPTFTEARIKDVDCQTQNGMLLLTLALREYRLQHGHYPKSLTELTPTCLQKLPDDPFAAQGTFQYHLDGKNYVLYSVGPDGVDDGGTPIDDPQQASSTNPNSRYFIKANSKGDVVAGTNLW